MIEDKELGLKVAENPSEATRELARQNLEKRISEMELTLELDKVLVEYLKKKNS